MSAATSAGAVVERLLDDERIHEQIGAAAANLRKASGRAQKQGGRAVGDQRLARQLSAAAAASRIAATRLVRGQDPEPERVGGIGSVVLLAVGVALLRAGLRSPA